MTTFFNRKLSHRSGGAFPVLWVELNYSK